MTRNMEPEYSTNLQRNKERAPNRFIGRRVCALIKNTKVIRDNL